MTHILTTIQRQQYGRSKVIALHLSQNQTKVNSFLPLKQKQQELIDELKNFQDQVDLTITQGTTGEKAKAKKAVAEFYHQICALTLSFLKQNPVPNLDFTFNITKRKITGQPDGNVLPLITKINQTITQKILPIPAFAPYDITPATLNQGLQLANHFHQFIGHVPAIRAQKSARHKAVNASVKTLARIIADLQLLITHFRNSDPEFYNSFTTAKKIRHVGIRHNVLTGTVTHGNQPLAGTKITLEETKTNKAKTVTSDIAGQYKLARTRAGFRKITATHPLYPAQTKIVKFIKGHTLELNWNFAE